MEGGKVMRIDAYAQVQQLYGNKKVHKVQKEARTGFKDQLQISSKGKDIQTAKNAVAGAQDVREDVVEPLKRTINAGTYEVSGEQFARKLFEKYCNGFTGRAFAARTSIYWIFTIHSFSK